MRPREVLHVCGLHPAGQPVVWAKVADLSLDGCFVKMPRPHWAQEPTSLVRQSYTVMIGKLVLSP